jgi:prolipoprotein diacylglyceryltransferase
VRPVLVELFGIAVPSYAALLVVSAVVAGLIRRLELRRLGWERDSSQRVVAAGALVGAILGAKLGMILFEPPDALAVTLSRAFALDLTGKTVIGGLAGGFLGVELAKWAIGHRRSTGDAWAVALPTAQAVGRIGCLLHGCCYGAPADLPWSVVLGGVPRHPAPLYEAFLDVLLALWLATIRDRPRPAGHLFRIYLVGYATIRFVVEAFRGDPHRVLGPLTLVQWVCLAAIVGFGRTLAQRPPTDRDAASTV